MARRKQTLGTRIKKYLASDSLAKSGRRATKKVRRASKRLTKKATKSVKKTRRITARKIKKLPKQLKRTKRKTLKAFRAASKRIKKLKRIGRKEFKRLSKAYQLRGKKLTARRQERRQEIKGTFDTSKSRIVQASADPGASRPGEPPKLRSGQGRYSIKAEVRQRGKQIVGRTYVDKKIAKYMAMWEFRQDGQQRPFLKPGLMNNLRQFQSKVGAELKRAATPVAKRKAVNK